MFSQGAEDNVFGLGDIYQKFQVELPGEKRSEDVCFQHRFSIGA